MPKKQPVRRFDPLRGLTRNALEAEAVYVRRELDGCARASLSENAAHLEYFRDVGQQALVALEQQVEALAERERVAVEYVIARDFYYIIELYRTHLGTDLEVAEPPENPPPAPVPKGPAKLPFHTWLFDMGDDEE